MLAVLLVWRWCQQPEHNLVIVASSLVTGVKEQSLLKGIERCIEAAGAELVMTDAGVGASLILRARGKEHVASGLHGLFEPPGAVECRCEVEGDHRISTALGLSLVEEIDSAINLALLVRAKALFVEFEGMGRAPGQSAEREKRKEWHKGSARLRGGQTFEQGRGQEQRECCSRKPLESLDREGANAGVEPRPLKRSNARGSGARHGGQVGAEVAPAGCCSDSAKEGLVEL